MDGHTVQVNQSKLGVTVVDGQDAGQVRGRTFDHRRGNLRVGELGIAAGADLHVHAREREILAHRHGRRVLDERIEHLALEFPAALRGRTGKVARGDVFQQLGLGHGPGRDAVIPVSQENAVFVAVARIQDCENLGPVGHAGQFDVGAPEIALEAAVLDGLRDLGRRDAARLRHLRHAALEDVRIDQVLRIDVGRVVLAGFILDAQLGHAVVGTDHQAGTVDIEPLAEMVVTVHGGLAHLDADGAGGVLDIEFAVQVAAPVAGDDLAADDHARADLDGMARLDVHLLKLGDGRIDRRHHRLPVFGHAVVPDQDRIPLLAGGQGRERNDE